MLPMKHCCNKYVIATTITPPANILNPNCCVGNEKRNGELESRIHEFYKLDFENLNDQEEGPKDMD